MNELRSSDPGDKYIEEDILNLLREKFQDEDSDEDIDCEAFYEHGQWWARVELEDGPRTFSVVDCETEIGEEYLDLEEV